MKRLTLTFALLSLFLGFSQTEILSTEVSGYTTASEGEHYITTDTNEFYIGLQSQTLRYVGKGIVEAKGTNDNDILIWNNTLKQWVASTVPFSQVWQLNGNSGNNTSHFLGNTDDVQLQLRSNNLTLLELGRRQTLGLVSNAHHDYVNPDQSIVHLRGHNGVSALQFQSDNAPLYKPILYTTTNGSFRLKASSSETDFFEIGSAGALNQGRLEFIIGDDGDEPIIFKRHDYRSGSFHKEFFRVQGSEATENAKTRFGININDTPVPVDTDFDDGYSGFNMANSTFQVNGSVSKSILQTTANLTLSEDHHTVILSGNHNITLPNAANCEGRIYVIKNPNQFATIISPYTDLNGSLNIQTIGQRSTIWLQSDGKVWQQINLSRGRVYEKLVIWAEEAGGLNPNAMEWSFGNGDVGRIGIPLPENWEIYALSFNADNTSNGSNTIRIQVLNTANNAVLHTFTASGANDNLIYTQTLNTPVPIAAGTTIGFRTIAINGAVNSARVAVFLRRLP